MTVAATFRLILLILAVLLALLAAFDLGRPRIHLGWLSLACLAGALAVPVA